MLLNMNFDLYVCTISTKWHNKKCKYCIMQVVNHCDKQKHKHMIHTTETYINVTLRAHISFL